METRKLQEVGGGTFTVSIPKSWADDHGLEAGTDVHLYDHLDGSIVVRSARKDGGDLASADLAIDGSEDGDTAGPALVEHALRAVHAIGFGTATLRPVEGFTDEQRRVARSVVRSLVGTELLVADADEITVKNFLDAADVSIRQAVVQLRFVACAIHREATTAFLAADADARDRLDDRTAEAHRLADLVSRHFTRSLCSLAEVDRLGVTRVELSDYNRTAGALERVAEQGASLARLGSDLPGPVPADLADDLRAAAEDAIAVVEDAAAAACNGHDRDDAHDALRRRDEVVDTVESLDDDLLAAAADGEIGATELRALARALDHLRRTADHGATIAEVAIRAGYRGEQL